MLLYRFFLFLYVDVDVVIAATHCIKHDANKANNDAEEIIELCEESGEDEGVPRDLCFTVWQNLTNTGSGHRSGMEVHLQGCIASLGWTLKTYEACKQNTCLATTKVKNYKDQMLFCCCNNSHCNREFYWKPKSDSHQIQTTKVDQRTSHIIDLNGSSWNTNTYVLLFVGVLCILSIAGLVTFFICSRSRSQESQIFVTRPHHKLFFESIEHQPINTLP